MNLAIRTDLTNCDREPIHIPGHIQSHGFLFSLAPDTLNIERVSANFKDFTGLDIEDVLGKPMDALTSTIVPRSGSSLRDIIKLGLLTGNFEQLNPQKVNVDGKEMFIIIHQHSNSLICEFEPSQTEVENITLQKIMSTALAVIQSSSTFPKLLNRVASLVKDITGYDRIMIYKFHKDDHGEVVAEAKEPELESWLNLHYPASDIPAQARELYKLNLVRIIADVGSVPSGLLAVPEKKQPLDLTHSVLRAVSPIHIEYLKNMQVGASFSISLMSKQRLWGLIACHSREPKFIDYNSRVACKFIGQLFSAALEFKHNEDAEVDTTKLKENQVVLFEQLLKEMDPVLGLVKKPITLIDITKASGAVFRFENKTYTIGNVPTEDEISQLAKWLNNSESGSFFQTSNLPALYPQAKHFSNIASGVMVTPLSLDYNEFIMWFKPEQVRTVDWAGEHQKTTNGQKDGNIRLSPRKSFAKWTEEVKNSSEEWSDIEIGAAIKLREDVIQVINKKANEIRKLNELLKDAYDELDTFSFTISHDLRTPLSSIKNYTEIILEDYGDQFNDEAKLLFSKVIKGTDKMAGLIRDVLQYSRVGRAEIEVMPLDMGKMLNEIREEVLAPHRHRNIELTIRNTPPLYGDKTMMMQLFTNLVSNAVKYSTNADPSKIEIDGNIKDNFVNYSVIDNGIGMDMKYATRIFELFRRLDNVNGVEGTGVGLAIAKRIIEKHNGKIWLESKPFNGTKFYISIPVKKKENA